MDTYQENLTKTAVSEERFIRLNKSRYQRIYQLLYKDVKLMTKTVTASSVSRENTFKIILGREISLKCVKDAI